MRGAQRPAISPPITITSGTNAAERVFFGLLLIGTPGPQFSLSYHWLPWERLGSGARRLRAVSGDTFERLVGGTFQDEYDAGVVFPTVSRPPDPAPRANGYAGVGIAPAGAPLSEGVHN